jgi:hypothetical protein
VGATRAFVAASDRGRKSFAGERGEEARVEPDGMARGGAALGAESMSARISASWSSRGQDMAQLG